MSTCRSCHRPVVWVQTEAKGSRPGRSIRLEATDDGRLLASTAGNVELAGETNSVARVVASGQGTYTVHDCRSRP